MEEPTYLIVKPLLVGAPSTARPMENFFVMFGQVVTTEAHLACAGAGLHTNNTADLSRKIEALSFLGSVGPVARGSHACTLYDSKHAAGICTGTIQTRTNAPLGLTSHSLDSTALCDA